MHTSTSVNMDMYMSHHNGLRTVSNTTTSAGTRHPMHGQQLRFSSSACVHSAGGGGAQKLTRSLVAGWAKAARHACSR